jgi:hypothetical protein
MFYTIMVFLHVIAIFGFLLSHGTSVGMAFGLKRERDPQKIRLLLELSGRSYPFMMVALGASLLSGIIAAFQGQWWKAGWIWSSLALLIIIMTLMYLFGSRTYGAARQAMEAPPGPRGSNEELFAILEKSNPVLLAVIGYGGYALIAWLMIAKPF